MKAVPVSVGLQPIYLHQSWVNTASLCMSKHGLADHPLYDGTPSEAMSFGTIEHAVIADQLDRLLNGKTFLPPQAADILALWRKIALEKDGFELDRQAPFEVLRTLCLEVRDALVEWHATVWLGGLKHETIVAYEVELEKPIGRLPNGRQIILRGTPDVIRVGALSDWKTSGRYWEQGKADSQIQGPTYALLAEHNYPHVAPIEAMDYWVWNRSKGTWDRVTQAITFDQMQAAQAAVLEWAGLDDAGFYPPTPGAAAGKAGRGWWCSAKYCNAWDACSFKALITDGVDLTEKRQRGWT